MLVLFAFRLEGGFKEKTLSCRASCHEEQSLGGAWMEGLDLGIWLWMWKFEVNEELS